MGKHHGKGGKSGLGKALGLAGLAVGAFNPAIFGLGTTHIMGAIMGLSLGTTIASAFQNQDNSETTSDFDSKMNTVDQNARIPLVYGTRKIGGLQSYHHVNKDKKYLQKDVILGEGNFCGCYGVTANNYVTNSNVSQAVASIRNTKYQDAYISIYDDWKNHFFHRTSNGRYLLLHANRQDVTIKLQGVNDLNYDSSNDYQCYMSKLFQYIEGVNYTNNLASEGWEVVRPVGVDDEPKCLAKFGTRNAYNTNVDLTIDSKQTGDTYITYYNGQQGAPSYYMQTGGYPNMAYLHCDLHYTEKLGSGNPTVNCIALGRAVLDTRTGKWGYSENPAMIVRDYLINTTFGAGRYITKDMLDEDSFIEVANYCDEKVTCKDAEGRTVVEPRYTLNIVLQQQQTYLEHLQQMLSSFAGFIVFANGKVALHIEKAENPIYAFTDDNIVEGSLSYKAPSSSDSPNKFNMKYIEPVLDWVSTSAVVEDLVDQSQPPVGRGKIVTKDIELIGVTSQSQALRLGKIYRDIIRLCPITCTFKTAMQAMHLEPGDVVTLTHNVVIDGTATPLFTNMPVRIIEIHDDNGEFTITCKQYNSSIYDDRLGSTLKQHEYTPVIKNESVLPTVVPAPRDLDAYTVYKQSADGSVYYDLVVEYNLPTGYNLETGLVYYKTNEDTDLEHLGIIDEDVTADEIGFSKDWQYAGESPNKFIFKNVHIGVTYKLLVRSRSNKGELSAEADSPTYSIAIERKSEVPNMPDNFRFVFGDECKFEWDAVTNSDIDFYELRSDEHAGESNGLIARTKSTSISVTLTERTGKIYLLAHNSTKKYGYPAMLTYNVKEPVTPTNVQIVGKLGGFVVSCDPIPNGCVGMDVYIDASGIEKTQIIASQNNVVTYMCNAGIYDVQIAYRDIFGEGSKSAIKTIVVKALIDDSFIKDEAISIGKVDKTITDAIEAAANSAGPELNNVKEDIAGLKTDAVNLAKKDTELQQTITGVQKNLDGLTSTVNNQAGQVSQLKQTTDSISSTVTANKTAQDKVNSAQATTNSSVQTQISQVSQKADGISSTVATITDNLNVTDLSKSPYKSITQLKQTTDSISSTVTANKTAQDKVNNAQATTNSSVQTQISQVSQKADGISSTVAAITDNLNVTDLSKSPYKSITQLKQTTDNISSTVTANKTAQDKTNQTLQSTIQQNATSITAVVNNLKDSSKATANYSAFTQLNNDINLRVKKGDVINQINVGDESILIDGKKVHITGDTVFDNNVIAKGMIQARAVTADKLAAQDITLGNNTATGVVAGAVKLDSDGMTVTGTNGSSIQFGQNGMTFKDSLNNTFAALGRFCTGVANDGDTVKFASAWDVVPTVFLFPNQLQTSAVGYTNVNIYQHIEPLNITKAGFKVCCQSVLKAGSGGSFVINNKFADWNMTRDGGGKTYTYTFDVPATASKLQVNLLGALSGKFEQDYWHDSDDDDGWDYYYHYSVLYVKYSVDGKLYSDYAESAYGSGDNTTNTNISKEIALNNNSSVTVAVMFRGFKDEDDGGGEINGQGKDFWKTMQGTCTLQSYSVDAASDSVIAHGTAGFIAIDPNSCPYTVTKG